MNTLLRKYGVIGVTRLARDYALTRILFPNSRIVRWPFYVRGRGIDFGKELTTGVGLRIDVIGDDGKTKLKFGNRVQLNDYVHIGVMESVVIEDDVLIGSKVLITDHNHGSYAGEVQSNPTEPQIKKMLKSKAVAIRRNVWVGEGVAILAGVEIGENSIVGCNSVVTRNVPPNTIVAGNPAIVIRQWSESEKRWLDNDQF